jgi:hypothetical protein
MTVPRAAPLGWVIDVYIVRISRPFVKYEIKASREYGGESLPGHYLVEKANNWLLPVPRPKLLYPVPQYTTPSTIAGPATTEPLA